MERWGFALIAVAEVALLVWTVQIIRRGRKVKAADAVILLIVLAGLVYDNVVLATGASIGPGDTLKYMSVPRYLLHGLFTPMLVVFCALAADRMNVPGYRSRERLTLWGAVAFFAIWYGLIQDLVNLKIGYVLENGVGGYKHVGTAGPPLAEIATVVGLLVIGGTMQRYVRWPWVFVGSSVMFVIAAFYASNGFLSNIGELILLSSLVFTANEAVKRFTAEKAARREEALRASRQRKAADVAEASA